MATVMVQKVGAAMVAALAGSILLSGCTSAGEPAGPTLGLFHADGPANGLAPAPRGGWYVGQAPSLSASGAAGWSPAAAARPGLLARWLGRRSNEQITAVVDKSLNLPLPSVLEVVNPQTGATLKVRVLERADLGGRLISLSEAAAPALGAQAGVPLTVQIRYAAPAIAYRSGGPLFSSVRKPQAVEHASAQPAVREPSAAVLATQNAAELILANAAAKPGPVQVALSTPPVRSEAPPALHEHAQSPRTTRIQVGAFADPANAQRAVARLAEAGATHVAQVQAGARKLYVVTLSQEGTDPEVLRAKVAQAGFRDALVRQF